MVTRRLTTRPVDFFISYSPADERWATWIAWELETAGYSTMLQAWDFVPGTNFIDFMDRGVSEAAVVISVLSRNYLSSRFGRLEWQAALRADPDDINRLVTVRVEDCPLEGLLSMITYLDLVGVTDPKSARTQLLGRLRQAVAGRAKPANRPGYPTDPSSMIQHSAVRQPEDEPGALPDSSDRSARRTPGTAPVFPPATPDRPAARSAVTMLHLPGPRFGRGLIPEGIPVTPAERQSRIYADLTRLTGDGAPAPDLLLVTGDVTETGSVREFAAATEFLTGLRVLLGLEPNRLIIVPGARDITRSACRAYFASCEADDIPPKPPFWPKWRHFTRLFQELYQGLDDLSFDSQQPWTLFPVPDLQLVIAGLNSTINDSHRDDDHYGWIGESQATWFAQRLRSFEQAQWLRVGVIRHAPSALGTRNAARDTGLLRDTGSFDRLVSQRLNLLLHGPVEAGSSLIAGSAGSSPIAGSAGSAAEGELLLVPPAGPDHWQLVQITAEGLTRIPCLSPDAPGASGVQVQRQWRAAATTFAPERTTDPDETTNPPDTGPSTPGPSTQPNPTRLLLDRISEVCLTRYHHPKIRLVEGAAPHLLVSYREDDFVRQQRVAAHIGELTTEDIERFLGQVHAADPDTGSELVYQGPPISQAVRELARRHGVRVRSFIEFQGLLDLREFVAGQSARLRADACYPPEMYVPQRFRELTGTDRAVRRDLVEELMRLLATDEGRFILLMGDFGRGKTFALHEVARRIPTELTHLIPILLELRSLDKAQSVEAMVAAHLAQHGEERIDLKAFNYMLRQGRIVLLFDGFDELATRMTYDRAADHLDMVLAAVADKAKIVLSSRSQHFRTDAQVLTALGERVGMVAQRRVMSIEDFSPDQIQRYLDNRFGADTDAAARRLRLLRDTQGLLGLSQNPRMLGFITELDDDRLAAVAESGPAISAAALYEEILGAWLSHEQQRTGGVHGASSGLTVGELWQAVTALAIRLWESNEQYLELADLAEVTEALSVLSEAQLSPHQTLHAVGAGSLLVRTEDGQLGMIHGSVVEWLVAKAIADQLASGEPALLSRRPLSALTVDFLCDLADTRSCQRWLRHVLADRDADEVNRRNAIKISARLRSMASTDLRGAVLRGEDLSYRELADADLTGADLTDARLVGADLSRAVLRNAVLAGARLDDAKLVGADLTGADLRRARLSQADLRDVVVTGSRWRGAALIDVTARPEFFTAAELHGAAIAPGQPVLSQFAPAAVGVSYGFEVGRLPNPVDYSRDGQTLAIGSDDGAVLLCDTASGLPLRTLHGHHGRIYAVAYGPDDRVLATGASDCMINLWDPATGEPLHRLEGCRDWVWPMGFNKTGNLLATGDSSGTVRLWDVATGALRHQLPGHTQHVWTVGFQPGGALLATGDDSGTVRLWDTATGSLCAEFSDHSGSVYRLIFSPDSALLATVDHGGTVRLYDIAQHRIRYELAGHGAPIYALDFHPDGTLLASGDTHGVVRLWEVPSGRGTALPLGRRGAIYWVRFVSRGDLLAIGGNDGVVRLWDTAGQQPSHELIGHKASTWPLTSRPDGQQLATSSNDGTTRLWDPASGQCTHLLRGHGRRVTSVAFNAAGTLLATSGNDGAVRLWDPRTGRLQRTLTGLGDRLISAFFDPASALIATPSNDGDVHLWNAESGDYQRALDVDTDYVWAATFSPDGDIVATANDDDSVQLWYRTTGRHVHTLSGHCGRVRSIAFNHAGDLLATGCDDSFVRLWDAGTGRCRATLRQHTDRVYAVAFSPDGSTLMSASHDGTTCIWNCRTGRLLRTRAGHTGRIWSAAIDPTGATIATAGDDLVVRLWDAATGEHRHTLHSHTRRVWSVAFSPDASQLATASDDGTVRIWDLTGDPAPQVRMTLLGLPEGWAALAPDGRYKLEGTVTGEFWHVIGTCRFEPGDLNLYLPAVRQLALDAEF